MKLLFFYFLVKFTYTYLPVIIFSRLPMFPLWKRCYQKVNIGFRLKHKKSERPSVGIKPFRLR